MLREPIVTVLEEASEAQATRVPETEESARSLNRKPE
jgi:hypothetical protein